MKRLYAPWRDAYNRKTEIDKEAMKSCPFCTASSAENEKHFVIERGQTALIMLNLYPYNAGHLLICPLRHIANLEDLTVQEQNELTRLTARSVTILKKILTPNGFNVGYNLGDYSSGGSIPDHLHLHIIPRWNGDTSFLPAMSDTKLIGIDLPQLYSQLTQAFSTTP